MQCISYWKPRFPLKSHFRLDLCPKCNCCKWTSCICSKTIICSLLLLHPVSSFLVYISSQTIICHSPNSNVHRICLDRKYSQDMKRAFNQKIKAEKNSIIIFFCSSWLSKSANSLATNLTGGRELEKSAREKAVSIQFTTSSRRLDGGAYCGAPVGGKCMVSKAKLVLYAFAV